MKKVMIMTSDAIDCPTQLTQLVFPLCHQNITEDMANASGYDDDNHDG